jgi:hypothetical protein
MHTAVQLSGAFLSAFFLALVVWVSFDTTRGVYRECLHTIQLGQYTYESVHCVVDDVYALNKKMQDACEEARAQSEMPIGRCVFDHFRALVDARIQLLINNNILPVFYWQTVVIPMLVVSSVVIVIFCVKTWSDQTKHRHEMAARQRADLAQANVLGSLLEALRERGALPDVGPLNGS